MASIKTITILGVTGNQGSAVAKTFLDTTGWKVRGITRSQHSETAQGLSRDGVDLVEANLDDEESLLNAFRGSHCIYANTDFFSLLSYPNLSDLLASKYSGLPLNQACMQHEFSQGMNVVNAAARVLAEGGPLETFVLSTLSHATKWSGGEITNLLHFDAKWMIENYLRQSHPMLASKTRFLQVGFYMPNVVNPMLLPKKNGADIYEFRWANITLSTMLPATCPSKDVGIFVRALIAAAPGTVLLGESDPVTVEAFLETWSAVTGYASELVSICTNELEAMIEPVMPSFGKEFAENFQYYRDFTYTGRDPEVVLPGDLGIDKSTLITFHQYLTECDWKALLQQ